MKVAVLTSGGDAPGMNAALRAVTRASLSRGWEVLGVEDGFAGLLAGKTRALGNRDVGGILQRGGTVLGTARSAQFATPAGRDRAVGRLEEAGVGGVVIIGGNGSLAGGRSLAGRGVPVVGLPATIDNDVWGTDTAIGVDTALNTALQAMDHIKDTASSHRRAHVVEVMGRDCGYLALMTAIAGGAEAVLVPEVAPRPEEIMASFRTSFARGKPHFIVVAAEGAQLSGDGFYRYVNETSGAFEARLTVLGHVQRGGSPTAFDRILSSRLGTAAVEALDGGAEDAMVGLRGRLTERVPLEEVVGRSRPLDPDLYRMAEVLAGLPQETSYGR